MENIHVLTLAAYRMRDEDIGGMFLILQWVYPLMIKLVYIQMLKSTILKSVKKKHDINMIAIRQIS